MAKKAFAYEFGGTVGTALNVLLLPFIVLLLAYWSRIGRIDLDAVVQTTAVVTKNPVLCPSCETNPNVLITCSVAVLAWFGFQVLLERFLPGPWVEGAPIGMDKIRLKYRINGHLAYWVTFLIFVTGWPTIVDGRLQLTSFPHYTFIFEHFAELALVTIAFSFVLSIYLYASSFVLIDGKPKILAAGGDSGVGIYDFFMGRELNPRIGTFDWKEFCELRPGLMAWVLLNVSSAHQQYTELGYVSGSMILINLFHMIYVWDGIFQESAILTTMDITTDGFGFMLVFGDLVWVPFTYSLQARYLVRHDPDFGRVELAAIVAVNMLGYWIFRSANGQKDSFRRNPNDPSVAQLNYLQTKRGTKLLLSGWWGMARKINYSGDYIMGLSWCLLCGFDSIVPYYYAIYFAILLVHRSGRDDHICQQKYGQDWDLYKEIVPYRFIPGII